MGVALHIYSFSSSLHRFELLQSIVYSNCIVAFFP